MIRRLPFTRQMVLLQVGVLLVLGAAALAAVSWLLQTTLNRQYEQRALSVARSIASDPHLGDLVVQHRQPAVQQLATRDEKATGALTIVVTDDHGIRLSHPNPKLIGKRVSTDPTEALAGKDVATIDRGTMGYAARGKVPLRDSAGRIVGEVSVGFAATEVSASLRSLLFVALPVGIAAILLGASLTWWLGRRLKRGLFGLEPDEVADLLREHDAVLFGISEGVLAVDGNHRVTMCNDEANRLLDNKIERGMAIAEVGLPPRLERAFAEGTDQHMTAVSGDRVLTARHRPVQQDGRELGSVLTLRDQTDLEELTSELASVRNMTGALRAQRHEYVNRMHTILGLLQTAMPDDALDYVRNSVTPLDESEIGSGSVQSNTIRAFFSGKAAHAAERGVHLVLSENSYVPRKLVAPVEVVTVLGNLVDNAIDATALSAVPVREVIVDLLASGPDLVVSVSNTGDGVPQELRSTLFVDGVSTKGDGRGMGLAIARQTAGRLGGSLILRSAGGRGELTVFIAELPGVLAGELLEVGSDDDPAEEDWS